ncbi:Hsp90 protein, partial [Opisthorchis viverrini]
ESEAVFIDGLNADRLAALRAEAEEREFQAEVNQMMKLIINSLYKNKEIFLRELISNASDALDKIRLLSLTDREALQATEELSIRIKANKEARTLHIIDTGIGMSKGDLAINLGTIAKSGTADFLSKWTSTQSGADASDLIGQFGVGFYSSFLVGKKVMVISKKNGSSQYIWESDAKKFHIAEDPRGDTLKRGTEIIIFLNDDADDYLEPETLQTYIKKYSQFINFPIYLWSSHVEKVNVTPGEPEENPADDADASVEEEKKDTEKTTEKTVWDWVLMNEQKPIWKKKPADITEEEYRSFYQALSGDKDEPLGRIHFKGEGDASFTAILFIPKRSPGDVFNVQYSYKDRIKLYVHRVFISDVAEDLLPKYLGFVVGIVDSDDLPLNVSREMLQQNQLIKVIRRKLIRKVIELIGKLSEEDYEKFWKEFSVHMKLGMVEDQTNRARLSKLLRFRTSLSGEKMSNLTDYVSHMKKDQDKIFYLTASSLVEARSSPFVERLVKKGYEIVYMIDPLDEFMMQSFTEFESKPLQNVARDGLSLDTSETKKALRELQQKEFESLLKWMKEDALKDQIEKAELSERLSDSPCALVAGRYGWSGNMERIMRAQAHQRGDDSSADFYSKMPKTMELNPRHPLVKELNTRVKHDASDPVAKDTAELLFHIATLRSGYALRDPVEFARKVELVMRKNLAVDEHEEVEPEPEESESLREEKPVTDEDADEKAGSINTSGPDTDESPAKTPSDEVGEPSNAKDEL